MDSMQSAIGMEAVGAGVRDERTFLRKTYFTLFMAVVAFVATEVVFFMSGIAAAVAPIMVSNWLLTLGGFMVLGWIVGYFTSRQASREMQYVQLGVTILLQALIFIPLLAYAVYFTDISVLTSAIWVTLAIFGGMTAIAAYSGKSFSFMGPFLAIIGIAAMIAIVGSILFSVTLGFYFTIAMVVFAAAVVLYETSKVIHDYTDEQYVLAATALFSGVALLFYYVLMAFVNRD